MHQIQFRLGLTALPRPQVDLRGLRLREGNGRGERRGKVWNGTEWGKGVRGGGTKDREGRGTPPWLLLIPRYEILKKPLIIIVTAISDITVTTFDLDTVSIFSDVYVCYMLSSVRLSSVCRL